MLCDCETLQFGKSFTLMNLAKTSVLAAQTLTAKAIFKKKRDKKAIPSNKNRVPENCLMPCI